MLYLRFLNNEMQRSGCTIFGNVKLQNRIHLKFFSFKIDNNVVKYAPVFFVELGYLPYKEQLHWKQYNIPPQDEFGMSSTYYKTIIEGNWAGQSIQFYTNPIRVTNFT